MWSSNDGGSPSSGCVSTGTAAASAASRYRWWPNRRRGTLGLTGCFVVPHPPVIVPEVGGRHLRAVAATVAAMQQLGEEARALDPDVIVLLSPHAPLHADRMGVGLAARYRGSLRDFGAPQVEVALDGDVELAETILEDALAWGVPVGPLEGFDGSHGTGPRHAGAALLHRARAGPAGETGPALLLVPRHADRIWPLEGPSPRP